MQAARVLHCVSSYPALPTYKSKMPENLGIYLTILYSDHTLGNSSCVAAVALGARVIEKHFTLQHDYSDFRDHQLSANPEEFKSLVNDIRNVELALGSFEKTVAPCEEQSRITMRRSIYASRDIPSHHTLVLGDLVCLRPAIGLDPTHMQDCVGKQVKVPLSSGDSLSTASF